MAAAVGAYTAAHGHPLDHPRPEEVGPPRWRTPAAAALAAAVVLALLTGLVVVRSLTRVPGPSVELGEDPSTSWVHEGERPDGGAAGDGATAGATTATGEPGASAPVDGDPTEDGGPGTDEDGGAAVVVVHVAGQVAAPGIVELSEGARVADAITAVGGATPGAELAAVNLAQVLVDGEQVYVPDATEAAALPPPAGPDAGPGTTSAAGPAGGGGVLVDLNTAGAAELEELPGIGPVLAQRIVDHRSRGPFTSVEELQEVTGIGPALLAGLRDLVRV
ncbi:ComEA family DNA-binding protein [Actinotalea sp. BY-33]|uniref:ComEA family DNA-binding protein n=2 Tax=Actinotalea soli TaxID=2819234 RepID=A0A939RTZ8_9CELL|nr:ComEA family DNA-binding protein [Actinotalea soli]